MNREQKHKISQQVVASISKINMYEQTIIKIVENPKVLFDSNLEIRLIGRKNIWETVNPEEVLWFLKKRLKEEKENLFQLEKKIK